MESFTDQDLLAELLEAQPLPAERHGGITSTEYGDARGISTRAGLTLLEKERKRGRLYREWTDVDGHGIYVYYKSGESTP